MEIKEIEFVGRTLPSSFISLKSKPGLGWSGLTKLPQPVVLFGKKHGIYSLNQDGMIRFSERYSVDDKVVPISIDDIVSDFILIPWGQSQRLNTCGTEVAFFLQNGTLVWDFKTKDRYSLKEVYSYRVEIPLSEHNIVRFYYYHCVSQYDTWVGVVNKSGVDTIDWPIKPTQPYMKKALEINTHIESAPTLPGFETPPVVDSTTLWKTVWNDEHYRLQSIK